jgi:putative ABC transport system permease protein
MGERLFKVLLWLYPRRFRLRYGEEQVEFYRQERQALGPHPGAGSLLAFWMRTLADNVGAAVRLQVRSLAGGGRGEAGNLAAHFRLFRLRERGTTPRRKHITGATGALLTELRYAFRSLRRSPAFSAVIATTLAVGIGANVAMFSIVDAVLLKALAFPESDRLVLARTTIDGQPAWDVSATDYYDYRDQVDAFAALGAIRTKLEDVTLTGVDQPMTLTATMASVNLFQTLGVTPEIGRLFVQEDADLADPGDVTVPRAVLISYRLWQRAFGGDPHVVGSTIRLDAWPSIVVGVMPAEFFFLHEVDVWWPLQPGGRYTGPRSAHVWTLVGRLADGVTLTEAQSQVDVVSARLQEAYPATNAGKGLSLSPLQASLVENYDAMLFILMATVGLVLLVACANVAGLLVARGAGRTRALSVMAALGASGARLTRQLLCESLLLAATAGVLGTALAIGLQAVALRMLPLEYVRITELGLSGPMLTSALLLSVGTALACGIIPAWLGSRTTPGEVLTGGPRTTEAGWGARVRSGLVVLQVAVSLTLLIGSGLLVKSFLRLKEVDPGFRPEGLITARVSLPFPRYPWPEARLRFFAGLLEGLREIPGVQAAGAAHLLPLADIAHLPIVAFNPANPPAGLREQRITKHRQVLPGFFDAMGIPILAGRDFSDHDCTNRERVVIINETMAEGLFGEKYPLGKTVVVPRWYGPPLELVVVGIVGDVRMLALDRKPERQMYSPAGLMSVSGSMGIAIRTRGNPAGFADPIRRVLRAIDPEVPLSHVSTMNEAVARTVARPRVLMTALTLLAAAALGLSVLGLYGMLAFHVARKVREIGIRVAVGATPRRIMFLVLTRGMILVALGLALGVGGAVFLTRLLREQLYQVQPTDPATFATVSVGLVAVAVLACLIPAWRAVRVDPVRAIQTE